MARALPQTMPHDPGRDQSGAEWQSLRGELVALLDQVESQVARTRVEPAYDINERMRDLRMQMDAAPAPEPNRHREALRSVQRAVDRFSDRDEPMPPLPANPRDTLQSAIDQIRSRPAAPVLPRAPEAPRIDEFAQAVGAMTARLERIESGLKSGLSSGGDIKLVADQVAQLAHVVELLAGAVGETGQVKRLEGQIASLGKIVSQSREMDISTVTRRLDDMSSAVGRLADLQVQFANKVENPVQSAAFKDGMQAIESSVRNVYDRIDSLERNGGVSPVEIEHLTTEMSRFTEAMRTTSTPQNLVELIDALNSRISDIESGDRLLHALRKDLGSLRDAVTVSLEPRFDALERRLDAMVPGTADFTEITHQLENLNARIAERPIDPGIGQIEAQVRQLVARMDQTGEQLSGLAKLYTGNEAQPLPDMEALADLVAERTSAALARFEPAAPLPDPGLAELEERITTLFHSIAPNKSADQLGGMRRGIDEVNDRLRRLEASLLERSGAVPMQPMAESPGRMDITHLIAAEDADLAALPETTPYDTPEMAWSAAPPAGDVMPAAPTVEAPLYAPAFPEPGPVPAALDARNGPRHRHPGLDDAETLAARYEAPPAPRPTSFELERVAPPPAPTPSLGMFEPAPQRDEAETDASPVAVSSRNTFIEAARRAAQRQAPAKPAANPNSLIGRALSRFQPQPGDKKEPAKLLAGDKPARTEWTPDPVPPVIEMPLETEPQLASEVMPEDAANAEDVPDGKESFLRRNRKVILLGAVFVGLCFLTYNLLMQRIAAEQAEVPVEAPLTTGSIDDTALPLADDAALDAAAPRVIPMVDSLKTGSIDAAAAQGFTTVPAQDMPAAFDAATALGESDSSAVVPLADSIVSPIKVEMPPEGVGPMELREAASNGDARAQFEVAAIFTEGRAVPQDYKAAAVWYERAAAQGFAPAQYRLGSLYENGDGIDKDLETAKLWYERAAEAGNRMSMHNLAALYASGGLGKQQFDSAAKWFEEAASRGMTDSQFNLGMLYARGLGVPQSLENSFKWFGIAALSGDKDASKARDDIARSLDAETVGRITAEVQAFKPAQIDLPANFAPIGTWAKGFDPGENISAREIVASVQVALGKLGYDVGVPDGVSGPKTSDAIKAFERATGMTEVGQINPRLLAVLGSQPV